MTHRGTSIAGRLTADMEDLRELYGTDPAEAERIRRAIVDELVALTSRESLTVKTGCEG